MRQTLLAARSGGYTSAPNIDSVLHTVIIFYHSPVKDILFRTLFCIQCKVYKTCPLQLKFFKDPRGARYLNFAPFPVKIDSKFRKKSLDEPNSMQCFYFFILLTLKRKDMNVNDVSGIEFDDGSKESNNSK